MCASRDDYSKFLTPMNGLFKQFSDKDNFVGSPAQHSNSVSKDEVCHYITDLLKFYLNGATTKWIFKIEKSNSLAKRCTSRSRILLRGINWKIELSFCVVLETCVPKPRDAVLGKSRKDNSKSQWIISAHNSDDNSKALQRVIYCND